MKTTVKIISTVLLMGAGLLSAQEDLQLRKYSAGLRIMNLYDMPSYKYDNELSTDLKGLNGTNTRFDLGVDLFGEAQLTPLIGFQAGLRLGGLTGANDVEYYKNNFQAGYLDMILILSNLDKKQDRKIPLNIYAKVGLGVGGFKATRYLTSDNSMNGTERGGYWEGRVGAGLQYQYNSFLRFDFDLSYNVAFDDGFDGYNYGTGSDPYLATGIGIAYTFGNREAKPMYSVSLFDESFSGMVSSEHKEVSVGRADSLSQTVDALNARLEELTAMLEAQNKKIEKHDERINGISAKANDFGPSTYWDKENRQIHIYFAFEDDVLTTDTKIILAEILSEFKGNITMMGYASKIIEPVYSQELEKRRSDNIRNYLVNELNFNSENIKSELAESVADLKDDRYFYRKILVKY